MKKNGARHQKRKIFYGLASISSLLIGILIYRLFRDMSNMILFSLLPKTVFAGTVPIQLNPSPFSSILMYNLPDMLWFLSAILFLRFIWFYRTKIQKLYVLSFYGISAIFEISQLSEKVPGTFDFLDLIFMGAGALAEGLLHKFFLSENKE